MIESDLSSLDNLRIADPETYVWVKGRMMMINRELSDESLCLLAEETIWGLSREPGLGRAVAEGLLHLMARGFIDRLETYLALVHRAAETGATLGRLVASFTPPVLEGDARLLEPFQKTISIMLGKGTYTLSAPLEAMAELIAAGEFDSASAYLDLLATTFQQQISYNQSLRLVYLIPKAVRGFPPRRRRAQIEALHNLARIDLQLVDPFLDGMERGLGLLDDKALAQFTALALTQYARAAESGIKFLSLASKVGRDACAALQRAVALMQVKSRLSRYLNARMGRPVAIESLSDLPAAMQGPPWVCCDGRFIYLPDEIDCFEHQDQNQALYRALVRLEAGYVECRTFDFDLERAADVYPEVAQWPGLQQGGDPVATMCDGERFVSAFSPAALARDLFTIYEQARVIVYLNRSYPGLMRQVMPVVRDEALKKGLAESNHLLAPVFAALVLNGDGSFSADWKLAGWRTRLIDLFYAHGDEKRPVESSARLVCMAFEHLKHVMGPGLNRYQPLVFPFERSIRWDLVTKAFAAREQSVLRIKMGLQEKGLHVYLSDLRNRLAHRQGQLCADDMVQLVLARNNGISPADAFIRISQLDFEALLQQSGINIATPARNSEEAVRYPEWDHHLHDYLHDHTYVREVPVQTDRDGDFYRQTLIRYRGLVTRMRRAFELLKPEGMTILRQWPEGDAFDYRALLDFAIDRRSGRIPSDRLFIKRLKQERDVAVLLLVDLSRSTANPAAGGDATVLDVAKEALVLFCEALQVIGDDFAIAGFSGTGRHAVDFYGIKDFQASMSDAVKARISVLSPQRSTRMGAAVRHATTLLAKAESRVRLIIVVSDGFPNDLGYKADYAIADTRRAVQEARARNFHVKAITVNIGSDPRLDDLYGRVHHHVIGDVRELPDKLLRLYGALTRF